MMYLHVVMLEASSNSACYESEADLQKNEKNLNLTLHYDTLTKLKFKTETYTN